MSDLPDGRYERLIDGSLARRLDKALGERWRERVQVSSLEQVDATATRRAVLIEAVRQRCCVHWSC